MKTTEDLKTMIAEQEIKVSTLEAAFKSNPCRNTATKLSNERVVLLNLNDELNNHPDTWKESRKQFAANLDDYRRSCYLAALEKSSK